MSKTQLKKEISGFDKDQLVQLILDLYSARKDAKEYFEFFLNPDLGALTDKYRAEILKEFSRGKYSRSNARISRVRTLIRQYASFGIGAEPVIDLMVESLKTGLIVERSKYVTKTYINGMKKLAVDILKEGDRHAVFDRAHRLLSEALSGAYGYRGFVNALREELEWSKI